jgi:hypothetical protein
VLADTLAKEGIASEERPLAAGDSYGEALAGVTPEDGLMLWLGPADIAGMAETIAPPRARFTIFSGTLAGGETAPCRRRGATSHC